jgi:ATP-binding cassette subfamily C protein
MGMRMKVNEFRRSSPLVRSLRILSKQDRAKILVVIVIQIMFGLLDLVGVALFGVLGALAVTGVQSSTPGNRVNSVLRILHLSEYNFQQQAAIIAILATLVFILRTVFSVVFLRRTLFFLSRRGSIISGNLISKVLNLPYLKLTQTSTQETLHAVTTGVGTVTVGIIGTSVSLISDISLLLVMGVGLLIVDPIIALGTVILFATIGLVLYKLMNSRAKALGMRDAKLTIEANESIVEVLQTYRDSIVRHRRGFYATKISDLRYQLASTQAEAAFLPNISKYVFESSVVLGAMLLSATQFLLQDSKHAVATLSVFLAAGTRIAPAVLRVQQGLIVIRGAIGNASPTLKLIEELESQETVIASPINVDFVHQGFLPSIKIEKMNLKYPNKSTYALREVNLEIKEGGFIAFVGPSGAGKTSLADVILGVVEPSDGKILVSGLNPLDAIAEWPGAIGYVPQDILISNTTIRGNVALGYAESTIDDLAVNDALEASQLNEFVSTLDHGADSLVGERGAKISGGQRQRLGIARALYTKPKLLVLDEATSALDASTELAISSAIQELRGKVTLIVIAHRLSTVIDADTIVYLKDGEILGIGDFTFLREQIPEFNVQAKLMGL